MAVRQGHVDGAASRRMLLKRRRRWLAAVSATSGGPTATPRRSVGSTQFPIIVLYSKMCRFRAGGIRQTKGQTDGRTNGQADRSIA